MPASLTQLAPKLLCDPQLIDGRSPKRRVGGRSRDRFLQPTVMLGRQTEQRHRVAGASRELDEAGAVVVLERGVHRRADVVDVVDHARPPLGLVGPFLLGRRAAQERSVVVAMTLGGRRTLAGVVEPLRSVLADRLEHAVAHRATSVVGEYERLVDERRDEVEHVERGTSPETSPSATSACAAARSNPPTRVESRRRATRSGSVRSA